MAGLAVYHVSRKWKSPLSSEELPLEEVSTLHEEKEFTGIIPM